MTTTTRPRPAFQLPRLQLLPPAELPTRAPAPAAPIAPPSPIPTLEAHGAANVGIVETDAAQIATFPTLEAHGAANVGIVEPAAPAAPIQIAPIRPIHRRNGALGLTIGVVLLTLVLAAALTAQRTMHGWPPGAH